MQFDLGYINVIECNDMQIIRLLINKHLRLYTKLWYININSC